MVRQPSERKGWEGGARAALAGGAGPAAIRRFDEKLVLEKLRRGAGGELHDALRLAVWDFGGQDNFYALHLLFLSRISVVLLPLNMSNFVKAADPAKRDASLRFVRFWLSSIYAATADPATGASPAPVFLVGTHKDEVSTPEQHQEVSEYLYEQLCGNPAWSAVVPFRKGEVATGRGLLWFFPVDNTRGNDDRVVQELKLAIEKQIEGEDYVKQRIPFTWMALYDALQSPERQQAKTLPLDECLALGESLGMGQGSVGIADEVRACLLFFNALGFVMYFDEPGLRDLVILNPVEFLIEPITKVICDYKIHVVDEHEDVKKKFPIEFLELQNHGVLHHKILPKLWAAFDNRDELEQLAVKFGLMVPLLSDAPSGGEAVADNSASVRYLVPSVLSSRTLERARTPPQLTAFIVFAARGKIESWGQATDLQAVVREGFFPLGVFARLVCRAVGWMQTVRGKFQQQCCNTSSLPRRRDCCSDSTSSRSCSPRRRAACGSRSPGPTRARSCTGSSGCWAATGGGTRARPRRGRAACSRSVRRASARALQFRSMAATARRGTQSTTGRCSFSMTSWSESRRTSRDTWFFGPGRHSSRISCASASSRGSHRASCASGTPPPPPLVLIGHAASLTPY